MSLRPQTPNDEGLKEWLGRHQHQAKIFETKPKKGAAIGTDFGRTPDITSTASDQSQQQPMPPQLTPSNGKPNMTSFNIHEIVRSAAADAIAKVLPSAAAAAIHERNDGANTEVSETVAKAKREYSANLSSMKQHNITEEEYIRSATTDGAGGPQMETSDY